MKTRVLIVVTVWLALLTVAHVSLNVGWDTLRGDVGELAGATRQELRVGFLPVT